MPLPRALAVLVLALACSGGAAGQESPTGLVTGMYNYALRVAGHQLDIVEDHAGALVSQAGVVYVVAGMASQAANDTVANGTGAAAGAPGIVQGGLGQAGDQANATQAQAHDLAAQEQAWLAEAEAGLRERVRATEHYAVQVYHATWSRVGNLS